MAEQKVVYRYEPLEVITPVAADWREDNKLDYNVKGRPAFSFVDVFAKPGQKVVANSGTMLWMDGNVHMQTSCVGGCCTSFYRTCSGETCCMNTFTGPPTGPGKISLGQHIPGDMLPFCVTPGNGWVISRRSYICGSQNLIVSSRFAGCCAALFSGEGAFLTKVTIQGDGQGMFFAGNYGSIERHDIPPGKLFYIDHGLFFAAHESVQINIGIVGNLVGFCCGGEGFVMSFMGPCVIYTKSRDPARLFDRSRTQGPGRSGRGAGGAGGAGGVGMGRK